MTTIIAGVATGLFAMYHFGRIAHFGLAANLIAVPVTALWIMPWAVASMALMPFGLEALALAPMTWGVDIVIGAARRVAAWPGAVGLVPAMPVGGAGCRGDWRIVVVPLAAALALYWPITLLERLTRGRRPYRIL